MPQLSSDDEDEETLASDDEEEVGWELSSEDEDVVVALVLRSVDVDSLLLVDEEWRVPDVDCFDEELLACDASSRAGVLPPLEHACRKASEAKVRPRANIAGGYLSFSWAPCRVDRPRRRGLAR